MEGITGLFVVTYWSTEPVEVSFIYLYEFRCAILRSLAFVILYLVLINNNN